jgi:hypothetical protein
MASAYIENPQSWNRYTYALNNPLRFVDPEGLKAKPVFGEYTDLTDEERRILGNSEITVGEGKDAKVLSGQALYDYMKANQQKELADFLNQTAVLSSVTFSNGRLAISYVNSVIKFKPDRIETRVESGFIDQVKAVSGKDAEAGKLYVGPENSSLLHGRYNTSFRENRTYNSQQLSFASDVQFKEAEIDIDEECPCEKAAGTHARRVVEHRLFGGKTDPYFVYGRLTADPAKDPKGRGLKPTYTIVK